MILARFLHSSPAKSFSFLIHLLFKLGRDVKYLFFFDSFLLFDSWSYFSFHSEFLLISSKRTLKSLDANSSHIWTRWKIAFITSFECKLARSKAITITSFLLNIATATELAVNIVEETVMVLWFDAHNSILTFLVSKPLWMPGLVGTWAIPREQWSEPV